MKYHASLDEQATRPGPNKQYGCLNRVFSKLNKNIVPPLMRHHKEVENNKGGGGKGGANL